MSVGFNTVSVVLILVALVFLILTTISTPVVPSFAVATAPDNDYGILGYCPTGNLNCPGASYPYELSSKDTSVNWLLDGNTRNNLARAFILCPIAAGINLLCLILIIVSHFFSSGIIIFGIVFNILCFIVTTVACVLVIIVFHPQVAWTGWILVGAAGANLLSIVFMFLALKLNNDPYNGLTDNDDSNDFSQFETKYGGGIGGGGINDGPTGFSGGNFLPPAPNPVTTGYSNSSGYNNTTRKYDNHDDSSSIINDYKANDSSNTITSSSIYNSNPQMTKDFTQNNRPYGSNHPKGSYDDRVNLVNGPNTPISSKQQIAPNYTPTVATPTLNDAPKSNVPQLPYPASGPLNKPPYGGANVSVFEHHPEVEGHLPFTEMDDDGDFPHQKRVSQGSGSMASDGDSDFTSVSQRAVNPEYRPPPGNYYGAQDLYVPPAQQYHPQLQPYQPMGVQSGNPPPPPPHGVRYGPGPVGPGPGLGPPGPGYMGPGPGPGPMGLGPGPMGPGPGPGPGPMSLGPGPMGPGPGYMGPGPGYMGPGPGPGHMPRPRQAPTVSDNALSHNPDFAVGRRKPGAKGGVPPPNRMGGMGPGRGPYGI